jgi:hypothetical protein
MHVSCCPVHERFAEVEHLDPPPDLEDEAHIMFDHEDPDLAVPHDLLQELTEFVAFRGVES